MVMIAILYQYYYLLFQLKILKKHRRIIDWEVAKSSWGVLILFGGGLALEKGISESGLAKWLGEQLKSLNGVSPILYCNRHNYFVLVFN